MLLVLNEELWLHVTYVHPFNNQIIDIPVPLVFRQYLQWKTSLWGGGLLDQTLWSCSNHEVKPNTRELFLNMCWTNRLRALQKLNKGEIWRRKYIILPQMYQEYPLMGRCVHLHTLAHMHRARYVHTHIHVHVNSFMAGASKWQCSHRIPGSVSWHGSRLPCHVKTCCYALMSFNFLANCWQKIMKSQGTQSTLRLQGKVRSPDTLSSS